MHPRHRRGEEDQVGAFNGFFGGVEAFVDDAQSDGFFEGFGAAGDTNDGFGEAELLEAKGEGAADEADADDADLLVASGLQ